MKSAVATEYVEYKNGKDLRDQIEKLNHRYFEENRMVEDIKIQNLFNPQTLLQNGKVYKETLGQAIINFKFTQLGMDLRGERNINA